MKKKIYSSSIHPQENQLAAFLQQPDALEHHDISLHLAYCASCREQLDMMCRLRADKENLVFESCDEQQQQLVDDFIDGQLSGHTKGDLKQAIKSDTAMLKSVLHSLSQLPDNDSPEFEKQQQSTQLTSILKDWLHRFTSSWLSIPATAVATVILSVLMFQAMGLFAVEQDLVTISRYQDNKNIRFLSPNRMPGIGFFSAATGYSEPYQNIKISLNDKHFLQLEWQPVAKAKEYNLKVNRYSEGHIILHDRITTTQTRSTITLTGNDFNQRFEWALSGDTTEGKSFITSGGFVINRMDN